MENRKVIEFCKVLSVLDDNAGLRIKVKIPQVDNDCKTLEDLPFAFPLLPKMLHINPKVGEFVLVITQDLGDGKSNRFFIGPVISQHCRMNFDPFDYSARCLLSGKQTDKPLPNPKMNPDNDGTLPEREEIALIGRKNGDLRIKDDEVLLRCGFKANPNGRGNDNLVFNRENLAYIQMKYKKMKDSRGKEYNSSINIVADKINLLSHQSKTNFNLTDKKDLVTDDEMEKIQSEAHPLIYGDDFMLFMKKLIHIFSNHTHPFAMDRPCFNETDLQTLSTDLDEMVSKDIKIN